MSSVNDIATHHSNLSTNIVAEVCQPLKQLAKEKTSEREEQIKSYNKNEANLQKQFQIFEKVRSCHFSKQKISLKLIGAKYVKK